MGGWFPLKVWATVIITFWVSSLTLNSASPVGVRMSLSRHHGVSAGENWSRLEQLRIGIKRDAERFGAWAATAAASLPEREGKVAMSPVLPAPENAGFLMDLHIGTPPVKLRSLMDTGSELMWTQCQPCVHCYPQDTPIFNPEKSTSFHACRLRNDTGGSCSRRIKYGDGSTVEGYAASETLTFRDHVSFPNITFLCGQNNSGGIGFNHNSGLVGLSRGPLSLVSQLNVSQFSYCLPGLGSNSTGTLSLGGASSSAGGGEHVTMTPLVRNPSTNDSAKSQYYYVSVEGISVGETRLESVPKEAFQLNRNGSGGMIVDTGTSLTYLPTAAFKAVVGEVEKQLKLSSDSSSDLPCFTLPSNEISFPRLTLHLQGTHGAAASNLSLPQGNVFIIEEDEVDGRLVNVTCLAIGDAGGGGSSPGVLGNFVQQNMMVTYDLAQNTLSFEPTNCSRHSSFRSHTS
ncbi:unnamed protein product [Cuscuta epithymum]|uniref:Peptidase A1 domain-containing protein n=1 Tax=Cuscuta epithymum TaxID=186058 RepID=A0AAV0GKB8_9ASTE|nr:unnamed protein product [Cuscuta epithymum]CAH9148009.1 unnamed protein product [Cuscuta epithymum]